MPESARVIILDSDPAMCNMVSRRLQRFGHEIVAEACGLPDLAEVLQTDEQKPVDVVLMSCNVQSHYARDMVLAVPQRLRERLPGVFVLGICGADPDLSLPGVFLPLQGTDRTIALDPGKNISEALHQAICEV